MRLLKRYLKLELGTLLKNDIRFQVIGRAEGLARDIQQELARARDATASCRGMRFNIALNYSGRAEIVDAARRAIESGVDPPASTSSDSANCSIRRASPTPICSSGRAAKCA